MEHAIWIKKPGEEGYIPIKKVKTELGEDVARREQYKCPSRKCGVKMITVFPKRARREGKEVHSDHFRASPEPHTPDCAGDGEREGVDDPIQGEIDTKPRHEVVKGGSYPVRYVKRSPPQRVPGDDEPTDGDGEPGPEGPEKPEGIWILDNTHTSKPETGHIRRIVEAYENPSYARSLMELRLPGCPARNYEDAFVDVDQVANGMALIKAPYIYKGAYGAHKVYGNNAIAIYFSHTFGIDTRVGLWVEKTLRPDVNREEIKRRLWRAARENNATVYVFGRFQLFGNWKYSIDIEAFGDLWITFPADSGA
jgi:hypothetical protein